MQKNANELPIIKITDFYVLCKWENLQNRQCIKYLCSPLYIMYIKLKKKKKR